jgi:drug/metabolite transporter (DMT)-like permease
MLEVALLTILFSVTTVISILLLGSRAIIGGEMNFINIVKIIFSWQFILGAVFAFASRLVFMLINSAIYKIPALSGSSTTVTTLITTVSLIFVIIANYLFLHEKINLLQGVGAVVIMFGIFLITK